MTYRAYDHRANGHRANDHRAVVVAPSVHRQLDLEWGCLDNIKQTINIEFTPNSGKLISRLRIYSISTPLEIDTIPAQDEYSIILYDCFAWRVSSYLNCQGGGQHQKALMSQDGRNRNCY